VCAAIEARGFESPTSVQTALLEPALAGRDVLVSAQTGSGKTVAFGLMLAPELASLAERGARDERACTPRLLVIAPTRELANQVRDELAWLLSPLGARVLAVTGGTSVVGELRALGRGADVLVGTPGRLCDHLSRKAVDPSHVAAVVLDEGDEMLDLGFRDELETILQTLPAERRTILCSATMPEGVAALARRYQKDPVRIAVNPPGGAHADIAHVAHLVRPSERLDAVVNLLLAAPDERTIVFVRTRAEAGEMGATLANLGFSAAALSGEMAQRERTQTMEAFRAGRVTVLIATDVAARGLDVPEVTRVVHADLPGDGATLTHRAGRTGRAGRKGESVLLVPPAGRGRAQGLLREAGIRSAQFRPVPQAAEIRAAAGERLRVRLGVAAASATAAGTDETDAAASAKGVAEVQPAYRALAARLLDGADPVDLVARLLGEVRFEGPCAPREVRPVELPTAPRPRAAWAPPQPEGAMAAPRERDGRGGDGGFTDAHVMFRVNFGERHGATPSRLLAMVCRRGGIRGQDVGAIRIGGDGSTFGVAPHVARGFTRAVSRRDERDPYVRIEPLAAGGAAGPRERGGYAAANDEAGTPWASSGPRTRGYARPAPGGAPTEHRAPSRTHRAWEDRNSAFAQALDSGVVGPQPEGAAPAPARKRFGSLRRA
jgi:ATP-dependent RNA helicase DeaD